MNQNEKKTNTLAILGFVFSFFIAIIGLVLSILGLNKSKETGSGKGLSIAGIIISSISIIMSILIIIFAPYYLSNNSSSLEILNSDLISGSYSTEYVNDTMFNITQNYCDVNIGDKLSFTVVNGKLNIKNNNTGEEYTVKNIGDIKTIMHLELYTGCGEDEIIVLTKDGKLYETDLHFNRNIDNISDFESKLNYIEFPYDIAEIGIIKNISPAQPKELLLKDINGVEYYRSGDKYYKISN